MADTTLINVQTMAPDLIISAGQFTLYLSDAKLELAKYVVKDELIEKAQRLLIAHYATKSKSSGGQITKKKLGPMEMSFSTANNDSSIWWEELQRLLPKKQIIQILS